MKEKIILVGGGGHCKSCIEVIESLNNYEIIGILDKKEKVGNKILDYKIIGTDKDIPQLIKKCPNFLITIGQIKSSEKRIEIFKKIKKYNGKLPVIVASTAYVSRYSDIKEGTIIMHHSFINSNVKIGKNCIINTKCLIEHDSIIGDFTHISTGAIINGSCIIGDNCFIGSGSVIKNNIKIKNSIVVGFGNVINNNLEKKGIYKYNNSLDEIKL